MDDYHEAFTCCSESCHPSRQVVLGVAQCGIAEDFVVDGLLPRIKPEVIPCNIIDTYSRIQKGGNSDFIVGDRTGMNRLSFLS